jgi:DNA-directed RNA polymerase II subunit RPB2
MAFIGKLSQKGEDADDNQKLMKKGKNILERNLLPHIGTDAESFTRKAYFIGYMIHKLLKAYLGQTSEDDRDHYGKKRLDMTGTLLISLFKDQFRKKFVEDARRRLEKEISKPQKVAIKF